MAKEMYGNKAKSTPTNRETYLTKEAYDASAKVPAQCSKPVEPIRDVHFQLNMLEHTIDGHLKLLEDLSVRLLPVRIELPTTGDNKAAVEETLSAVGNRIRHLRHTLGRGSVEIKAMLDELQV